MEKMKKLESLFNNVKDFSNEKEETLRRFSYMDDMDHKEIEEERILRENEKDRLFSLLKKSQQKKQQKIIKTLGEGSFGKVYLCQNEDGQKFVLKKIRILSEDIWNKSIKEFQMTQKLNHENIIKYIDYSLEKTENDMFANLTLEYCQSGDLKNFVQQSSPLNIETILNFSLQILQGMKHIHENKLIHRDLKPENIFLFSTNENTYELKIGDFGLITSDNVTEKSIAGTLKYMSCEVLRGDKYSYLTDIFSFGAILYFMCTKKEKPFGQIIFKENFKQEMENDLKEYNIPDKIGNIILECLNIDPEKRPDSSRLIEITEEGMRSGCFIL